MDEQQRAALRAQLHGGRSEGERTIAVEERTRVIAVASGKGGVGKSSLTVNLALALRARGLEVGVVDADIYGYSIPGMLGIQQRPVVVDKMIVPPVAHDLKVMSIGFFLDDGGSVVWRGPMLHRALEQFLSDVYWGPLDYLLIDMPPGTGDVGLSLGQLLPRSEAVLVTTPAAGRPARRLARGPDGREARPAADRRDREHVEPRLPLLRRGHVPVRPGRRRGAGRRARRAPARRGAARAGAARGQRQRGCRSSSAIPTRPPRGPSRRSRSGSQPPGRHRPGPCASRRHLPCSRADEAERQPRDARSGRRRPRQGVLRGARLAGRDGHPGDRLLSGERRRRSCSGRATSSRGDSGVADDGARWSGITLAHNVGSARRGGRAHRASARARERRSRESRPRRSTAAMPASSATSTATPGRSPTTPASASARMEASFSRVPASERCSRHSRTGDFSAPFSTPIVP